jgi:threonine-phosphate decarboxylase
MAQTRLLVHEEREYLGRAGRPGGAEGLPQRGELSAGEADPAGATAAQLRHAILRHRLIIRDASNFRGLDERFFRIAVRRRFENDRLLQALKQCLNAWCDLP